MIDMYRETFIEFRRFQMTRNYLIQVYLARYAICPDASPLTFYFTRRRVATTSQASFYREIHKAKYSTTVAPVSRFYFTRRRVATTSQASFYREIHKAKYSTTVAPVSRFYFTRRRVDA